MAELEYAFFPADLPAETPAGYTRLYFGAEFCSWRLPSANALLEALHWCRQRSWSFTLVTPVLSEPERQGLKPTLDRVLPKLTMGDEVVISDWGALELVRENHPEIEIVLGRALSGQKRGPRILDLQLSVDEVDYFRQGSFYGSESSALLRDLGVRRVELDNLLQGLAPLPDGLCGSLHHPYAMVTSSRNCPYRPAGSATSCPAPCGEVFTLQSGDTGVRLLQSGNTQFLENSRLPDDLSALGINRLVTHPGLPR